MLVGLGSRLGFRPFAKQSYKSFIFNYMQEKTPQSFGEIIAELQQISKSSKVVLTTYKFFIDEKEVQKVEWLKMEKILQSANSLSVQPYTIAKEKVIVNDKMILFNYKIFTNG